MAEDRLELTRDDLPEELTPDTIRALPIDDLRRLAQPGNGVLDAEDQARFDAALHQVMSETARRVAGRIDTTEWATALRETRRAGRHGRRAGSTRSDEQLRRLTRRIGEQVDVAEGLAPGVDWSFAQPVEPPADPSSSEQTEPQPPAEPEPARVSSGGAETVSDLEQRLTDQVELVQVMTEIAEVGKRTYALEQQRDLQNTRGVFFGFVVSVAVLVAGWAPVVAAEDWAERVWILGLTVGTCGLAGLVYALVRRWQERDEPGDDESAA